MQINNTVLYETPKCSTISRPHTRRSTNSGALDASWILARSSIFSVQSVTESDMIWDNTSNLRSSMICHQNQRAPTGTQMPYCSEKTVSLGKLLFETVCSWQATQIPKYRITCHDRHHSRINSNNPWQRIVQGCTDPSSLLPSLLQPFL